MYVVGRPRLFLQLEGAVLLGASLLLFNTTHQHWWWVPALLFVPDVFMVGYARSTHLGALIYTSDTPISCQLVWLSTGCIAIDRLCSVSV